MAAVSTMIAATLILETFNPKSTTSVHLAKGECVQSQGVTVCVQPGRQAMVGSVMIYGRDDGGPTHVARWDSYKDAHHEK